MIKHLKLLESSSFLDSRGDFTNLMNDVDEFTSVKLAKTTFAGTFRGFHQQSFPHQQEKLVCCLNGSILDIVINLNKYHPDYKKVSYFELSGTNKKSLFIPDFYYHSYFSLSDNVQVLYLVKGVHRPKFEKGIRFNDPSFNIELPYEPRYVSDKDLSWEDYEES